MKHAAWILLTIAMLAMEAPLLRQIDRWWLAPDLLVLATLYLGSRSSWTLGLLCAAGLGLAKDAFCLAAPVGIFTEIGALTFVVTRLLGRRVDLTSALPTMAAAGGATFGAVAVFLAFEAIFHRSFDAFEEVLRASPSMALGTMVLAPLIFGLYDRVGGSFATRDRMRALPDRPRRSLDR